MDKLLESISNYVKEHISEFHQARISKLEKLNLKDLLKSKNPYLYRAKNLNTPSKVVESIASAYMSSAEETMFGNWLEGLAIYIAGKVYGGKKSSAQGIDLEMDKDGIHYVISIKSGPKWSNSSSMAKLEQDFGRAVKAFHTSGNKIPCVPIEACCYGKKNSTSDHTVLAGQDFWAFISGNENLYTEIIEPLGTDAYKQNEEYKKEYGKMLTRFEKDFANEYSDADGNIKWEEIVKMNSGSKNK